MKQIQPPAISELKQDVGGRNKSGHDGCRMRYRKYDAYRRRNQSSPPPPLIIRLPAAVLPVLRLRIAACTVPAVAVAAVILPGACDGCARRRQPGDEAALRLIAQHRDEFGAVVGFARQRLV